jgi:two-component system, OmpR family, sensor kinase
MAPPTTPGSTWQRIKELPGRTPLRVKLIAAVLALVTAALAVISFAGIAVLRGYLLGQVDDQLSAIANNPNSNIPLAVATYIVSGHQSAGGFSVEWLPKSGRAHQVVVEFAGLQNGQPYRPLPGPDAYHGASWLNQGLDHPVTVSSADGSTRWRVVSHTQPVYLGPSQLPVTGTIIVGFDVTNIYRTINELTTIDLIISGLLLIVVAFLGTAVIRSSLRPLTDIEQTAEAIAAGDLTRRVPDSDPRTEVGKLGMSLNTMLAHIETSFRARTASEEAARRSEEAARRSAAAASRSEDRIRRFVADASHELRTPLTAIRGYAEYYRQRGGVKTPTANGAQASVAPAAAGEPASAADSALTRPDLDHLIERVEQEATRMGLLVDDMLLLARLDQERPLDFRTVDLLAIAADALHDARVIAPERTITLTVGTPEAALVLGDEAGLRQVVGNLMNNAMMHTPNATAIDITIRVAMLSNGRAPVDPSEPAVVLEVVDRGPGLTEDQKEHVFERFYRTDRARSRSAGGTGLGLAIVSAMVAAHHGQVWVDSEPGHGATFGFALPLAPEARFNSH